MEFYEWVQDNENFPINKRNDKKTYFDNFVEDYQDFKKWLTRKKFIIWVQKYASFIEGLSKLSIWICPVRSNL